MSQDIYSARSIAVILKQISLDPVTSEIMKQCSYSRDIWGHKDAHAPVLSLYCLLGVEIHACLP